VSDIFISYAAEDRSRVRLLADALAGLGWSVWLDRHIPTGSTFPQEIAKALDEARCVVVVWSRHSISSSWVREEAEEGRKRGVLIPVLIDEIRPPLGFGLIQAASLIGWDGDPGAEAFEKLAADVAGVIRAPAGPAPAVPPILPTKPAHPVRQPQTAGPSSESRAASRRSFPWRSLGVWLMAAVAVAAVLAYNAYRTGRIADRGSPPAAATGVRLSAVLAEGGQPLSRGVAFDVFEAAANAEGHRKHITGSSHPNPSAWFPLPAGRYFVTARYLDASTGAEVEVTPAGATRQVMNLRAGFLRVSAVLAGGQAVSGAVYDVYAEPDVEGRRTRITGSSHQSQASAQFLLPAGRYLVTAAHGGANARADTEIAAGVTQDLQLRLMPVTKR